MTFEDLLVQLSQAARTALELAGVDSFIKLAEYSEEEIMAWQGIGKQTLSVINEALVANKLHLRKDTNPILDYINNQDIKYQDRLREVRAAILAVIPQAKEKITWAMPTFWDEHNIIHFAAFKKHMGLYPGPDAIVFFADRLKNYKTSKGAIQFPYDKAFDLELIQDIAEWCYKTSHHH